MIARFLPLALLAAIPAAGAFELPEWASARAILDQREAIGPGRSARPSGTLQSGLTLYGLADPSLGESLSARLEARGSLFRKSIEKPHAWIIRGDVKQANLAWRSPGWEARAGQLLTPWGRSDAVNPTDFLAGKDYTFLATRDELRRVGAPGARVSFVPSEGNSPLEVTGVWHARYAQSKLLIPTSGVPSGIAIQTEPDSPRLFGDRQEWAVKLAWLQSSWDVSLSYFDGRSRFGQFVWDGSRVDLRYLPVRAIGNDFSVAFDAFVLKGESAYYFYDVGKRGTGDLALTQPDHFEGVLGVERPFGERFRVLAQLLYRLHPSLRDSQTYVGATPIETAIVRGVARANALIQNYQDRSRLGATFLLGWNEEEGNWTAELAAVGNFVGGDYVLRPKVARKLGDSLRASAGLDFYGGPEDRPLGSLRSYRSAFVEAEMAL